MTQQPFSDYQYIIAYAAIILIMFFAIKTRVGYVTVYYSLMLFAFAMVLLNSNLLVDILKPISSNQ